MKIDLVDDEPILRELYKTVIESSGFDVDCFADAEDIWLMQIQTNTRHPILHLSLMFACRENRATS